MPDVKLRGSVVGETALKRYHVYPGSTGAYTAGDAVGSVITLSDIVRWENGGGIIISMAIIDKANQKKGFDLYLFDAAIPSSDVVDNVPPPAVAAAYLDTYIGRISVADSDFTSHSSDQGEATVPFLALPVQSKPGSRNLYAYILTRGTPTYASTDDLIFTLGIVQD